MKKMLVALVLGTLLVSSGAAYGKEPLMQDLTMKEASISEMKQDSRTFAVDSSIKTKKVKFEDSVKYFV